MTAGVQFGFSGPEKDLFRIGEVSRLTGTKQFVLRYWETEFPMLKPVKSPKGHRLYRREDVDTVLRIKQLLYDEGFTIAGARRHLIDQSSSPERLPDGYAAGQGALAGPPDSNGRAFLESSRPAAPPLASSEQRVVLDRQTLLDLRDSLRSFLTLLENE